MNKIYKILVGTHNKGKFNEISDLLPKKLEKISIHFRDHLQKYLQAKILGPINAPIYKIKRKFRIRLLIRAKKNYKIQKILSESIKKFRLESGIKLIVDIDPISFN